MSVETPVEKRPIEATAREPPRSTMLAIVPPWRVRRRFCGCQGGIGESDGGESETERLVARWMGRWVDWREKGRRIPCAASGYPAQSRPCPASRLLSGTALPVSSTARGRHPGDSYVFTEEPTLRLDIVLRVPELIGRDLAYLASRPESAMKDRHTWDRQQVDSLPRRIPESSRLTAFTKGAGANLVVIVSKFGGVNSRWVLGSVGIRRRREPTSR